MRTTQRPRQSMAAAARRPCLSSSTARPRQVGGGGEGEGRRGPAAARSAAGVVELPHFGPLTRKARAESADG